MGIYHQAIAGYGFTATREDLLRVVAEFGLIPEDEDAEDYGKDELAELIAKRFEIEYVSVDNFSDYEGEIALGFFDVTDSYGLTSVRPISEYKKTSVVLAAVEMGIKDGCQHYIGLSVL